ncbi:MAG: LysE family transporter [Solibacillus sp.]
MEAIFHGIFLAFGLILPLGVQNVFVFTQGVTQPHVVRALPAAFTAAICDTLLIVLAVFGLSLIVLQFEWLRLFLLCGGVLFLFYMGFVMWKSGAAQLEGEAMPVKKQIVFALSVSLLNPHALLDTIGVIGTSAMLYTGAAQLMFMFACITMSWVWFIGLAFTGALVKKLKLPGAVFILFNKLSAVFIWCMALYLLYGLLISLQIERY